MSNNFEYKEYIPANARVVVDYKAKEKVKFSYPRSWTYKKAVWKQAYPTVIGFFGALHTMPLLLLMYYVGFPLGLIFGAKYLIENSGKIGIDSLETATGIETIGIMGLMVIPITLYVFGIPALFTWWLSRDKERMGKWIPKLGYLTSKIEGVIKEKKFKPKDILDKKAYIPSFSNVYLDYDCKGEFSDYLEKIEILEHQFKYNFRNPFLFFRKKEIKNDYNFRAIFYFSKKPKKGSMGVKFV